MALIHHIIQTRSQQDFQPLYCLAKKPTGLSSATLPCPGVDSIHPLQYLAQESTALNRHITQLRSRQDSCLPYYLAQQPTGLPPATLPSPGLTGLSPATIPRPGPDRTLTHHITQPKNRQSFHLPHYLAQEPTGLSPTTLPSPGAERTLIRHITQPGS